ncbi:unnamed protein product [Diabrotica balteata]|uniref:C2H2-type domain-containing protein n=1 Tax=Diabrotica balteata TaxID=107213 RepID=A0A9N9TDE2_DIABA|nr:unnamed protein product [Diabrotica balteata]
MSVICLICRQRYEEIITNSFFNPVYEGLSISNILKSVSTLQIDENKKQSSNICEECTSVIINFYKLVKSYNNREAVLNDSTKQEHYFIEEQDYDNYVECETESYKENSDQEDKQITTHTQDWAEGHKTQEDLESKFPKIKENSPVPEEKINAKVFDEMGNEEISSVKYTCDECGDSFLYKVGFSSHMVQKHSIYIENHMYSQYSTQITVKIPAPKGITFARKYHNKKNTKILTESFQCQICKEHSKSADELKEHYNTHKTHICEHCGAAFLKHSYLREHLVAHTTERRYPCDICGKKFKYRNGLSVHRNIHVNFRGFMCETCGKGFNARSTLKTHMKLKHTNERNYPCPECDLSFKVKSWLDKHYSRKHTLNRTKDFVCNVCGMAYLNKTTLTRHISEKHTGTPVRHYCTICEKSYSMKNKLSLHQQKKHGIILNTPSQVLL